MAIYPFMTIDDDIEVVHTELTADNTVKVYFEQPVESAFNSIECTIPEYKWEKNKGFNEEQLKYLDKYLHDVEDIIFELAAEGGFDACKDTENGQIKELAYQARIKELEKKIHEVPEEYLQAVELYIDYIIERHNK